MNVKGEEIFEEISKLCNFCDPQMAREFYYAMIRVISRGVKSGKRVVLPNWGTYILHSMPGRIVRDVHTGECKSVKNYKVVKFIPCKKVRTYFRGL